MDSVARGSTARFTIPLYAPGTNILTDPDEYPTGPQFALYRGSLASAPVPGFERLPFTRKLDRGLYELDLIIPTVAVSQPTDTTIEGQGLLDGEHVLKLALGSAGGRALVDSDGQPPIRQFTILPPASEINDERPYVTPAELSELWGINEVTEAEIRFAQVVLDGSLNRPTLWPHIYSGERHELPGDRNQFKLQVTPVIRIFGAVTSQPVRATGALGRYGYGRRDKRVLNQVNYDYISAMAIFGSPPQFTSIPADAIDCHHATGQCWLPTGFFLVSYSQVEFTYEAGLRQLPKKVKAAMAELVEYIRFKGYANLSSYTEGRISRQTAEGFVPATVKHNLDEFRIKTYR